MKNLIKQIIKFGIVGGIAFVIDYSLLYVLTEYLGIYYFYSSIFSFTVSLVFNYFASIKWVFNVTKKQTTNEIILFVLLSLLGLGINQAVMYITVESLKMYYMISKIFATAIVMVWNFITRKIFIER